MLTVEVSYAITSHLAWKTKVRTALRSGNFSEICVDPHACQLGKWLDGDGKGAFHDDGQYHKIYNMHAEVHRLCRDLSLAEKPSESLIDAWDRKSEEFLSLLRELR